MKRSEDPGTVSCNRKLKEQSKDPDQEGHRADKGEGEQKVTWSVTSWLLAFCFLICTCPCLFGAIGIGSFFAIMFPSYRLFCWTGFTGNSSSYQVVPEEGTDEQDNWAPRFSGICAAQACLNKLSLLLMFTAGMLFTEDPHVGPPKYILAATLPFVLWGRWVEWCLLKVFGGVFSITRDGVAFFFGALDAYDECSDGIVLSNMILADHLIHTAFVRTFELSSWTLVRAFAPVANIVHLWGMAAIFLLMSQMSQLLLSSLDTTRLEAFSAEELQQKSPRQSTQIYSLIAESAGMCALADRLESMEEEQSDKGLRVVGLGLARVLLENAIQAMISTSFLMLLGIESLLDQPVTLLSAVLSLLAMLKKAFAMLKSAFDLIMMDGVDKDVAKRGYILAFFGFCIMIITAWVAARLCYIERCPHHAWEISAGCMSLRED